MRQHARLRPGTHAGRGTAARTRRPRRPTTANGAKLGVPGPPVTFAVTSLAEMRRVRREGEHDRREDAARPSSLTSRREPPAPAQRPNAASTAAGADSRARRSRSRAAGNADRRARRASFCSSSTRPLAGDRRTTPVSVRPPAHDRHEHARRPAGSSAPTSGPARSTATTSRPPRAAAHQSPWRHRARKSETTKTNVPAGTSASAGPELAERPGEGRRRRRRRARAHAIEHVARRRGAGGEAATGRRRCRRGPARREPPQPRGRSRPRRHTPQRPCPARELGRVEPPSSGGGRRRSQRAATLPVRLAAPRTRSEPCAEETRADAYQSIIDIGSPGRYGRVPAISEPRPRRVLRRSPNGEPTSRRRGTRGNARRRSLKGVARCRRESSQCGEGLGAASTQASQTRRATLFDGRLLLRHVVGVSTRRCGEHRDEQTLDVGGLRMVAPARSASARTARSSASDPRTDAPECDERQVARGAHELDDPAAQQRVDVHALDRRVAARVTSATETTSVSASSGWPACCPSTIWTSSSSIRIAERRAQEEAVELGLGKRERPLVARSGSRSRSGRTDPEGSG